MPNPALDTGIDRTQGPRTGARRTRGPRIRPWLAGVAMLLGMGFAEGQGRSDEEIRRAWRKLEEPEQKEALEWFEFEVRSSDHIHAQLLRFALALDETPRDEIPEVGEMRFFDPEVHAPAQPIARKWLSPTSSKVRREQERLLGHRTPRRLRAIYHYDAGRQDIVRTGDPADRDRVFENILMGFPPDIDLAEARVEALLDDGSFMSSYVAFGHAYTDRAGKIYPGITLYDAHDSSEVIEMPDVDTLGILHTIRDDWQSFKAPVPERQHKRLYGMIGEAFVPLRQHRHIHRALARTYLHGEPVLEGGFEVQYDMLHTLWETHRSDPAELAKVLPEPGDWGEFLEKKHRSWQRDPEVAASGRVRREALVAGGAHWRALFERILHDGFRAYDR